MKQMVNSNLLSVYSYAITIRLINSNKAQQQVKKVSVNMSFWISTIKEEINYLKYMKNIFKYIGKKYI